MKSMKINALKYALTLAAVLAISGTGWAKKPTFAGPGVDGQLDPTRTSVTLSVDVPQQTCQTTTSNQDPVTLQTTMQEYSYSVKAYMLQPSGRILAIGFSDPTVFDCVNDQNVNVIITAIQGLSFKPGAATVIYKVTETTTTTVTAADGTVLSTTVATNVLNEYGSRVNLHP